ncbi:MAG: alpha/beta fold hydrolase, partial [Calditrichaeota bacterium]|nr:alpha/beta fold hydrolase [Calditrichota bacterium]
MSILLCLYFSLAIQFEAYLSKDFQIKQSVESVYGYQIKIERGVINVPNNRLNPSYYISLPYIRFFCLKEKAGTPIFFLAGGPGDNAFYHKRTIQAHYAETFLNYGDIIFFNQRGGPDSSPDLSFSDGFELPLDRSLLDPETMNEFVKQFKIQLSKVDDQVVFNDYNTAENAADLDDIRQLFGYDKIILWGHSYGSHLGLAYINQFENHVDRAMFTGVNGLNDRFRIPSDSDPVWYRIHNYVQSDSVLSRQVPDFLALVRSVHNSFRQKAKWVTLDFRTAHSYESRGALKRAELWFRNLWTDSVRIKLGLAELQFSIMWHLQSSTSIRDIVWYYHQISQGNYRQIALDNVRYVKLAYSNSPLARTLMIYPMAIASYASPERINAIESDRDDAFLSKILNFPFYNKQIHEALKINYLPETFRHQKRSSIPLLLFSGDLDSRTTIQAGRDVLNDFPNGKQIIVKGATHNLLQTDGRIRDAMENFIQSKPVTIDTIDTHIQFRKLSEQRIAARLLELSSDSTLSDFTLMAVDSVQLYDSGTLNAIAYYYLNREHEDIKLAKKIFQLNIQLFPNEANPYDSMGEAYFREKDFDTARSYYKKSIALNPMNRNAY